MCQHPPNKYILNLPNLNISSKPKNKLINHLLSVVSILRVGCNKIRYYTSFPVFIYYLQSVFPLGTGLEYIILLMPLHPWLSIVLIPETWRLSLPWDKQYKGFIIGMWREIFVMIDNHWLVTLLLVLWNKLFPKRKVNLQSHYFSVTLNDKFPDNKNILFRLSPSLYACFSTLLSQQKKLLFCSSWKRE